MFWPRIREYQLEQQVRALLPGIRALQAAGVAREEAVRQAALFADTCWDTPALLQLERKLLERTPSNA